MSAAARAADGGRDAGFRLVARAAALALALGAALVPSRIAFAAGQEITAAPPLLLAEAGSGAGTGEDDPAVRRSGPRPTGLPLPRFASLRSSEANMRAGPGIRYPVEWVYRRRGLPVKIIAEFDTWRKVQDWRGTVGWMHRSMLSGRRMAIVAVKDLIVLRKPRPGAPAVARVERGVIARLRRCRNAWCRIEAGGLTGWVPQVAIWGTEPGEVFD